MDNFSCSKQDFERLAEATKELEVNNIHVGGAFHEAQEKYRKVCCHRDMLIEDQTKLRQALETAVKDLERSKCSKTILNITRTDYVECSVDMWRYYVKIDPSWLACRICVDRDVDGKVIRVYAVQS